MQKNKTVLISKKLADVLFHFKNTNEVQLLAGCTGTEIENLKEKSVSIRAIPELTTIDRHERYIEYGSAVTISKMISSGTGKLPEFLLEALLSIGTEQIRNIATIGGNICAKGIKHTLWAPLLALNARLEIKDSSDTKIIQFNKFEGVQEKELLTKIRIPLEEWDIQIFRRIGPTNKLTPLSASFTFLVETQRGMIANIKVVFAGNTVFYSPEFENRIIGTRLPLSEKMIDSLIEEAKVVYKNEKTFENESPIIKAQFLNLLRNSFEQLT
ncbi:FAD binding domain-containing protein [Treponema sp.]|uniref:FAD binding domain-containing protein n=1 Tax=Treponema sp. TaxID=166 RepID=UPI00298EB4CD|nr:FAD binding domain-containing protein [Treponema sp.]MCQ2242500.1 FAD binding domain-containing protein [Treponema sp.]